MVQRELTSIRGACDTPSGLAFPMSRRCEPENDAGAGNETHLRGTWMSLGMGLEDHRITRCCAAVEGIYCGRTDHRCGVLCEPIPSPFNSSSCAAAGLDRCRTDVGPASLTGERKG